MLDNLAESSRLDRERVMALITQGCISLIGRGVIVLVIRKRLAHPQIALRYAGPIAIDRAYPGDDLALGIEADILDQEIPHRGDIPSHRSIVRARG